MAKPLVILDLLNLFCSPTEIPHKVSTISNCIKTTSNTKDEIYKIWFNVDSSDGFPDLSITSFRYREYGKEALRRTISTLNPDIILWCSNSEYVLEHPNNIIITANIRNRIAMYNATPLNIGSTTEQLDFTSLDYLLDYFEEAPILYAHRLNILKYYSEYMKKYYGPSIKSARK